MTSHLAWGGGLHSCVGRVLSWRTLLTAASHVLATFTVTRDPGPGAGDTEVKHLPVLRPSTPAAFILKRK